MDLTIRRARDGDEERIAAFAIRLVEQHVAYDPERFSLFATAEGAKFFYKERSSDPASAVIVAVTGTRLVGFAYVERDDRNYAEMLEGGAWLHDLYVEPLAQSSGAGRNLLDAAIEAAQEMGAKKLLLTVASSNSVARGFFERAGFRPTMSEMTLNLVDSL